MQFKDFEIRPVKSLDGVIDPKRFELVSVGLRLVENWVDGLDQFIIKWCEMAEVCMEEGK